METVRCGKKRVERSRCGVGKGGEGKGAEGDWGEGKGAAGSSELGEETIEETIDASTGTSGLSLHQGAASHLKQQDSRFKH